MFLFSSSVSLSFSLFFFYGAIPVLQDLPCPGIRPLMPRGSALSLPIAGFHLASILLSALELWQADTQAGRICRLRIIPCLCISPRRSFLSDPARAASPSAVRNGHGGVLLSTWLAPSSWNAQPLTWRPFAHSSLRALCSACPGIAESSLAPKSFLKPLWQTLCYLRLGTFGLGIA